jgi:hypothetical protein
MKAAAAAHLAEAQAHAQALAHEQNGGSDGGSGSGSGNGGRPKKGSAGAGAGGRKRHVLFSADVGPMAFPTGPLVGVPAAGSEDGTDGNGTKAVKPRKKASPTSAKKRAADTDADGDAAGGMDDNGVAPPAPKVSLI